MYCILLKHVRVQHANLMQSHNLLSPVPLTAAILFAHQLGKRAGLDVTGVGMVVHSATPEMDSMTVFGDKGNFTRRLLLRKRGTSAYSMKGGGEQQGGGYASGSQMPGGLALQPHATMHLDISLVIAYKGNTNGDIVSNLVSGGRLAGGSIAGFWKPVIREFSDIESVVRSMPRGYWVSDASDRVRERLQRDENMDILEAILTDARRPDGEPAAAGGNAPSKQSGQTDADDKPSDRGWCLPVTIGYAALHAPAVREDAPRHPNTGAPLKHAYAESVTGLVRLDHINRFYPKKDSRDEAVSAFLPPLRLWRHTWSDIPSGNGSISLFHITQGD